MLWDWHPITEQGENLSVTTEIPAGGVIRCIVADSGARVEWEPVIEYVRGP